MYFFPLVLPKKNYGTSCLYIIIFLPDYIIKRYCRFFRVKAKIIGWIRCSNPQGSAGMVITIASFYQLIKKRGLFLILFEPCSKAGYSRKAPCFRVNWAWICLPASSTHELGHPGLFFFFFNSSRLLHRIIMRII